MAYLGGFDPSTSLRTSEVRCKDYTTQQVLGFWRAEFQRSAVGPKVSRGVRETEEMEEFVEVFNVIFKLRICPLSMQRLYTMTVGT